MNIIKAKSPDLENTLIEYLLRDYENFGVENLFIPAGGTPELLYRRLSESFLSHFSSFSFWQIDDILTGSKAGMFESFFEKHLSPFLSQIKPIRKYNFSYQHSFSSILGLGTNGHVAFHEPHIPENFSFGCVELGEETIKYLQLPSTDKYPTWGITYGLSSFLKSQSIYLIVKGNHKRNILKRFIEDDNSIPAVKLKKHPNLFLFVDESLSDLF